ncbi:MAG: preprotein translocase subunit SecG [Lachnospiraceae bacterium]|nr:preprotein translocase subunit SecG [Lachnospiraceae bacterium]
MSAGKIVLTVLFVVLCIALVIMVLIQKGKSAGLTGSIAGGGADTFWGQNKSRSFEGKIDFATKAAAGAFLVLALLLNVVK